MMRWPEELPYPQADSLQYVGADATDVTDVLYGPARTRLARRHAGGSYQFSIWFTASQAEAFEAWVNELIEFDNGEWYAPWIGGGQVVAFVNEYEMKPLGRGWQIGALVVPLRIDETICDDHLSEIFGGVLRDPGDVSDSYKDDGAAADIYRDDFPLSLIASEPC